MHLIFLQQLCPGMVDTEFHQRCRNLTDEQEAKRKEQAHVSFFEVQILLYFLFGFNGYKIQNCWQDFCPESNRKIIPK